MIMFAILFGGAMIVGIACLILGVYGSFQQPTPIERLPSIGLVLLGIVILASLIFPLTWVLVLVIQR
jgi:hypothetical protein